MSIVFISRVRSLMAVTAMAAYLSMGTQSLRR